MRVVITGANRGIGLELTRQYLAQGHEVVAGCRHPHQASELNTLAASSALTVLQLDVTNAPSITNFVHELGSAPVDVLINNAGVYGPKAAAGVGMEEFAGPALNDIDPADWLKVLEVNTIAPLMVTREILPLMTDSPYKKVVMISTMMGSVTDKDYGGAYIYSSSKTALNMVGKTLSNEIAAQGFDVMMIHPGWVQTDMGGKNADTTVVDSASGIIKVIATEKSSGQFINFDGTARQW